MIEVLEKPVGAVSRANRKDSAFRPGKLVVTLFDG